MEQLQNKEVIMNLEFLKKSYENLVENGAGMGRIVGKGLDCPVHIKDYRELYQSHADVIGAAIAAVKKQSPEKPEKKPDKICELVQHYFCPECGRYFGQAGIHNIILFQKERYCQGEGCGQAIDWNSEK